MPLSDYSKNGTVELFHFTDNFKFLQDKDVIILDPDKSKKNYHSNNEFKRAATPRIFFYVDIKHKERFFNRSDLYKAEFSEDKIYDVSVDQDQLRQEWGGHGGFDVFFELVKKNSYEGLYYEIDNGMAVVVLFVPVEAQLVQQVKENFFRNTNRMKRI